jgi:FMN-dependent NADH-azoreductase
MAKLDMNQINAFSNSVARAASQFQEFERQREEMVEQQRAIERMLVAQPVVKASVDSPLKELVDTIKAQNEILSKQVDLLVEENERQKAQIATVEETEKQARNEALHSRVFNWVTFGVTTAISIAALIVSIVFAQ